MLKKYIKELKGGKEIPKAIWRMALSISNIATRLVSILPTTIMTIKLWHGC